MGHFSTKQKRSFTVDCTDFLWNSSIFYPYLAISYGSKFVSIFFYNFVIIYEMVETVQMRVFIFKCTGILKVESAQVMLAESQVWLNELAEPGLNPSQLIQNYFMENLYVLFEINWISTSILSHFWWQPIRDEDLSRYFSVIGCRRESDKIDVDVN